MRKKVLVAGFATRHVVQSAYGAGYEVYAVDHFCDQDLSLYARETFPFEELDDLFPAVEEMCRRQAPDIVVATSGAEALPSRKFCGTPPEKVQRFLDKLMTHQFFEDLGISTPALLPEGIYPAMLKPRFGSGGWRNKVVETGEARAAWVGKFGDIPSISQDVVEGVPCSVCCIADGSAAVAIATNRQILRGTDDARYGFSGSTTPFRETAPGRLVSTAERIAAASGCLGTIGIDFVSGKDLYAIEINPRFQATLDTVEMATGMNLFSAHIGAFRGILPETRPSCRQVACRKILFADHDLVVTTSLLRLFPAVADIPWPGTCFEEEQAVISVYGWGASEEAAETLLDKHIRTVQQYMGGRLYE
jgi:hypothetical protein